MRMDSRLDFRNRELLRAYYNAAKQVKTERDAYILAINTPASSYYASYDSIYRIMLSMENNSTTKGSNTSQLLYSTLYRIYKRERALHPQKTKKDIIKYIITLPAPRFYIEVDTARKIINKYAKLQRLNKRK